MKLAPKLVLTILLLLGILLAAGGGWLLKTDFERNFDQARTRMIEAGAELAQTLADIQRLLDA